MHAGGFEQKENGREFENVAHKGNLRRLAPLVNPKGGNGYDWNCRAEWNCDRLEVTFPLRGQESHNQLEPGRARVVALSSFGGEISS
jgi:hypothetical protein